MAGPSEITIGGVNLLATALKTVFTDATDTLKENVTFHNATRGTQATWVQTQAWDGRVIGTTYTIDWATYFSIHLGIKEAASGNWEIFLYPIYGAYNDPLKRPFYTRLTITVSIAGLTGDTEVELDLAPTADVIGHDQGIPCTVVVWNPTTETVVSSVEGHTLAFSETTRIKQNPNHTGFDNDGEFVLRYDHTVESEDRAEFYVAASWPGHFVASDGTFLRGDIAGPGQNHGFSHGEAGPYVHKDDRDATNYPITHLVNPREAYVDADAWDNTWENFGVPQRHDSGIGPLCMNIISRGGTSYMRDFGMAWLVKDLAARVLVQLPSPTTPHSKAEFLYNYDEGAMRGKGRIMWSMSLLIRALILLEAVRDTAVDTEVTTLKNALLVRGADVIAMLKQDYDNGSWLERFEGDKIQIWELGHYWQGMLIYQESVLEIFGTLDAKVHAMMVTFAEKLHLETLEWINAATHPRGGKTYTGTAGWYLEYQIFLTPGQENNSIPTTGIGPKLVAVYECAKVNGIDQGAKQDAIITQYAAPGVNYKWHLGTSARTLFGSISATGVGTATTGNPTTTYGSSISATGVFGARANANIVGGAATTIRQGTTIAATYVSIGTAIVIDES